MTTPSELSRSIGIESKQIRRFLRKRYQRTADEHNSRWQLNEEQVRAVCARFRVPVPNTTAPTSMPNQTRTNSMNSAVDRTEKDEHYVINICDEILGERSERQYRFDWLRGDRNARGVSATLPVDAYYPRHRLVIEYRERQHVESVPFFDKQDRLTISGVHRGEQRRLYDRRRETEIPKHGLRLMIVSFSDLDHDMHKKLRRNRPHDENVIRDMLHRVLYPD